jgi:hypothetical protein
MKIANGLLIFYIPVGSLPPYKCEQLMDRMKEKIKQDQEEREEWDLPDDIMSLWIPDRTINRIKIQFINFRQFSKATVRKIENLKKAYENQEGK